ncbi:TetR family transcriptional regulator [Streptomyces sp. SID11385]|uniref:TetR/AcrR family transcriptional regulator n=1 Tax=Streptomyces sp. SID11385 TaxID=2706031 RepID=UPI0013CDDADA|nr:TetR family transcriptional regulator [Streptomyces sp. SID11385]NEA42068.1 TetR/AcrR family transcriptional regulator [Streptomyces sp. SID11385]
MPELPSTPRGAATRRRILDAATEEFALRGIAGARIERIISAARTNKAQLYGYFGNKDGLFDAVVADRTSDIVEMIPFDADDLPGWAVGLYEQNLRRPNLVRLIAWTRLERRPGGLWIDDPQRGPKLAAMRAAQEAGRLREGDPFELLSLVIAMACAWSPVSHVYAATAEEPAEDHERRKALLREAVRCVVAP